MLTEGALQFFLEVSYVDTMECYAGFQDCMDQSYLSMRAVGHWNSCKPAVLIPRVDRTFVHGPRTGQDVLDELRDTCPFNSSDSTLRK